MVYLTATAKCGAERRGAALRGSRVTQGKQKRPYRVQGERTHRPAQARGSQRGPHRRVRGRADISDDPPHFAMKWHEPEPAPGAAIG